MALTDQSRGLVWAKPASTQPQQRAIGIGLAGITALISGFSIFVNGYGVRRFDDATTYTTAKNLVAAAVVTTLLLATRRLRSDRTEQIQAADHTPLPRRLRAFALAAVAVIGGSVPFVLFFEGLSRSTSTDAAFLHKTLVAWVAILGAALLKERLGTLHYLAIALILVGYAAQMGGIGFPVLGTGEFLILAATVCWSAEVVLGRYILQRGVQELTLSTARMLGGVLILLAWSVIRGALGDLTSLTAEQWSWALLTGMFLSGYVISWHFALARAQAVDVTAMLVFGAVLTAILNAGIRDIAIQPLGLLLLAFGGLLIAVEALRPSTQARLT